jgi:hypothetical protein
MNERLINIVFVKDYKSFILAFDKKDKSDYILNVSKLIKDKFNTKFIIPNKVQSFLLNYEIKKLLDKAITLKNDKYSRVIYLNSNLSITSILNTIDFINEEYLGFTFNYQLIDSLDSDLNDVKFPEYLNIVTTKKEPQY